MGWPLYLTWNRGGKQRWVSPGREGVLGTRPPPLPLVLLQFSRIQDLGKLSSNCSGEPCRLLPCLPGGTFLLARPHPLPPFLGMKYLTQ